jgi:hypothetical protein
VIDPHIVFEGFDAASWASLVHLFVPDRPPATAREREAMAPHAHGTLVVVTDEERPVAAFVTDRGRIDVERVGSLETLAETCAHVGAERAVVLKAGAVERITEAAAERMELHADYVTQWLTLLAVLREAERAGELRRWPERSRRPLPTPQVLQHTLDVVLPQQRTLLAVLWNEHRVVTAVAVRRGHRGIDRVVGPHPILTWAGPLSGDLQRDHRALHRGVTQMLGDVHLGVFGQRRRIDELLRRPDPGAWAKAVATREVIVHPTPGYAAVALATDTARAAAGWASSALEGLELQAIVGPMSRLGSIGSGVRGSVTKALGFDPLAALRDRLRASEPSDD